MVVVVHREALVAESIAAALGRYPAIAPVAVATTPQDAKRMGEHADAVALDTGMAQTERLAGLLRRRGVRVVFLGGPDPNGYGVHVSMGDPVEVLAAALVPGSAKSNGRSAISSLTPRQRQIMGLVARGLAAKQVARHLGISAKTVEHHKTKIFSKLGVPNQAAAVSLMQGGDGGFPPLSRHSGAK
jgi:DNA-binding NarL/FixJ family response regulator